MGILRESRRRVFVGDDDVLEAHQNNSRHWHRIRSTNGLERLHGEIKRRTRAVGAFPDRASALRLVTAVAVQVTAIWTDRRYLDIFLLTTKEAVEAKAA